MNAREITMSLGGRWHGRFGSAHCPICQPDRRRDQNALTLADGRDGRLLAHCKKTGCAFVDIVAALALTDGSNLPPDPHEVAARKAEREAETRKALAKCARIWAGTVPLAGTGGDAYLRGRGIVLSLPDALRWHANLLNATSGRRFPAMVAKVEPTWGLHRIFLPPDGKRDKLMLGPCAGGAVRLCDGPGPLLVGEGIESTLSALQLLDRDDVAAWAALSTSGMRGLVLPDRPGELILAVDGDAPGRAAGGDLAERAAALGWAVSLADPGDGADWNDKLREGVAA